MNNPVYKFKMGVNKMDIAGLDLILKDSDILKCGGELLHEAIKHSKPDLVSHLLAKGVSLTMEPGDANIEDDKNYRKRPFIISAALAGDVDTFEVLINGGANAKAKGCVGLSKKKKNQVITNVVGAAAFAGSNELLAFLTTKMGKSDLEFECKEKEDIKQRGAFVREMTGFTPLMLAIAQGEETR